MKKRVGIFNVLDRHNDLTKRMNEYGRFGMSNKLDEEDGEELNQDELNPEDEPQDEDGVNGGLNLDNLDNNDDFSSEDDDALDLDSLGDDNMEDDSFDLGDDNMNLNLDDTTEPDEEIDVTDFVEKSSELTQKVDSQVQTMTQQLDNLTQKLTTMDQMIGKIQQIEDEITAMRPPKPIETLKLRSLDSYPYNQGIDDYWKHKEIEIEKLRDFNRVDNQEYVLTSDDVNNYSDIEMKNSLTPSKSQSAPPFNTVKTNQQQSSSFNRQKE